MIKAAAETRAPGPAADRPRRWAAACKGQARWMSGRYALPDALSIRWSNPAVDPARRERRPAGNGVSMQEIENSTRRVLDELVAAWNHRDVDGFLRLFAEDALY